MPTLDEQVAGLKHRIAQAQQASARAEHERSLAEDGLASALGALKSEFGVGSVEVAQQVLAKLDGQAEAECRRAAELLDQAEGD